MHDVMMIVNGNPSGAMILASGSTFGFSIGFDLGNGSLGEYTAFEGSKIASPQCGAPPYTEVNAEPTMTSIGSIVSIHPLLELPLPFLNRSTQWAGAGR